MSAGFPSILEPVGTCREDGKRPDGLTLIPWKDGKCLLWDATCVDTLAACHIAGTAGNAGAAALEAEYKKRTKYQSLEAQYIFTPLGFETLGPWGPEAKKLIKKIGVLISTESGEMRSVSFLRQRVSIAIQRGNASSILSTLPSTSALDEVFFLA